jgi:outer membrane protein assembly factor BamB
LAIFSYRRLNGVELRTGKLLWHFPWVFNDGADSPDPVVVGKRVFISTAYRNGATVIDFTNKQPTQIWFKKDIQDEFGSSIYLNGYLYVPHGDTRHRTAYLKCVDFNTGEEVWCRDTGHCSLIYVNDKFVLLNQWGELTIMKASEKGFNDLSKAKVVETSSRVRCWTAPVLSNGRIYIRTNVGDLICVDVSLSRTE